MLVAEARAKVHAHLAADAQIVIPPKPEVSNFAAIVDIYLERRTPHWKPSTRATNECYQSRSLQFQQADFFPATTKLAAEASD